MSYTADQDRYSKMTYRRCGNSGIQLPLLSLGLWQNFGQQDSDEKARDIIRFAFDNGITHFDLANNYGPPPGAAEETFGKVLKKDLSVYRDELIISTKAGYTMWPGPYGDWGSKKYMVSSLDQSLKRMGIDYVDIFYHHRHDPSTPLEETMGALDLIVKQGKALYAGISNYDAGVASRAIDMLHSMGTPCLIHQPKYSMLVRTPEEGLLDVLGEKNVGCIAFSPLAQGLLTDKYLKDIPADSRVALQRGNGALEASSLSGDLLKKIAMLNDVAMERGQSLAQLAVSWILRDRRITSVLVGVSKVKQLEDLLKVQDAAPIEKYHLDRIDAILAV